MNLELNTNSSENSLTAAAPLKYAAAPVAAREEDIHLAMLSNANLPGFEMLDEGLKFVDLRKTSPAPASAFDGYVLPTLAA